MHDATLPFAPAAGSPVVPGRATGRPGRGRIAPRPDPTGGARVGASPRERSGPPRAALWLVLGLSVAALAALVALGADLAAAGRAPAASTAEREAALNAAVVARFYADAWNRGDPGPLGELVAPDHRYHDPANPDVGPGVEGLARFLAGHRAAFPDAAVTLDDVVAAGDRVVVRFTERGTHRGPALGVEGTDRPVVVTGVAVFRVAHRQIAETWVAWDSAGLARQLGLYLVPVPGADGGWMPAPSVPGEPF